MRYGIITDTHFNNWKTFEGQDNQSGISKRLIEQKVVVIKALDIFTENKVKCVIHGGDWVHAVGIIQNVVLNIIKQVANEIKSRGLLCISAIGNHDTPIRSNPDLVDFITSVISDFAGGFISVPEVKVINYHDEVNYDEIKGYKIVILHKIPKSSMVGNYMFTDGVDWRTLAKNNDFVFFAHIHQKQKLADNCFVLGSPMHFTFGDEGERGVWVVDTDTNIVEFFPIESPKFLTVDKPNEVKDDGNYYRVLHTNKKIENDKVISVITPTFFQERLKAHNFRDILVEWAKINDKGSEYLTKLEKLIGTKFESSTNIINGRITEVHIENFISIKDATYEIKDGFTLVVGSSDEFDSNGSGKTSLFESIFWCLFGETTKGLTGNDVIRRGSEDCSVSLTIKTIKDSYYIKRSRKDGVSVVIPSPDEGEDITEGMRQQQRQELIEKTILGFNKNLYLSSCYFSQENIFMLTKLSDTEKTNMIIDVLGFLKYDELYASVLTNIAKIKTEIELNQNAKNEYIENKNIYTAKIDELNTQVNDKYNAEIKKNQGRIGELKGDKVDSSLEILSKYEKQLSEKKTVFECDIKKYENEIYLLNNKRNLSVFQRDAFKTQLKDIDKRLLILKALDIDSVCDKCGSKINKENVGEFINENTTKQKELMGLIDSTNVDISGYDKNISESTGALESSKGSVADIIDKLNKVYDKTIEVEKRKTAVEECEKVIASILEKIEETNKLIKQYDGIINEVENNVMKLDSIKEGLDKELEIFEFWKVAFSPKGIKSLLLDRFCNDFNLIINEYLSQISDGNMSIVVSPVSILKSGEERNKIGMTIRIKNHDVKYETLSGGEKRRVDISICFGLNRYVSNKYNLSSHGLLGMIILDEVMSFIDESGSESIAQLLYNEGKEKAVFCIDHALNLESFADNIWNVRKTKGISEIERNK